MIMILFNLSLEKVVWRFYLMMAVVIGSLFIGIPALALLALPIFLSTIMGLSFRAKQAAKVADHVKPITKEIYNKKTAA